MSDPIAVLCPSRSRVEELRGMTQSVVTTSKNARVIAYIDDDQRDLYGDLGFDGRLLMHYGPRVGPVASANALCVKYRDQFSAFGLLTDDTRVQTAGWEDYAEGKFAGWPKRIGVVSPAHNHGVHVDMPFVSREWLDAIGWFAYPKAYHFVWPIIIGLIAEAAGCIDHASKSVFRLEHTYSVFTNREHEKMDCQEFFYFAALELADVVRRVQKAQRA